MKILIASTPEQEEKIQELIEYMYCTVFPDYFTDDEIRQMDDLKVLHTHVHEVEYVGMLKEAFQIISSLQTLIAIIETGSEEKVYREMFAHNAGIIRGFGISFPFSFDQFSEGHDCDNHISLYAKPANQLLI
ncbi:conserved hypothetical protein [Bacillus sp. 349Y]|nr:conserved hypothetical protein [Bacillus sp. 349Y]